MTYHKTGIRRAPDSTDLPLLLAEACRLVGHTAPTLTPRASQVLRDFQRASCGDVRYPLAALQQVLRIAATCPPETRHVVSEAIRAFEIANAPAMWELPTIDACRREQRTNYEGDAALFAYLPRQDAPSRERLVETMVAQEGATRAVLDALHAERASKSLISIP